MTGFLDHFSEGSASYSEFRPTYPDAMFEAIHARAPAHRLVWDCATGSGQAAGSLSRYFQTVVATDGSIAQLSNARSAPNIHYVCSLAERPALAEGMVDCVTVAQAAHWLNHDAFNASVLEVARPGALVVLWSYGLSRVSPAVDELIQELYTDILGGYWAPERRYVDDGYRTLSFPYEEIAWPEITMDVEWSLDQFAGYTSTWSAVRNYRRARGSTVLTQWLEKLHAAWGGSMPRRVAWPLAVRAGYVHAAFGP